MDDLNGYVILAGVCLIFGTLAWAGFTTLLQRLRANKRRSRKRGSGRYLSRSKEA
jgi:hypothetical protein